MPTEFKNLEQGTIFTIGNDVYIKVEEGKTVDDAFFNAVNLVDGALEFFLRCEVVIPRKSAKLVFD